MIDPDPSRDLTREAVHAAMAERAERSGIRRVHLLAFRDLDDPGAGGAEVHAAHLGAHLVQAGLEVDHHTGRVPGGAAELWRDGVRVRRRGGRLGVFPRTALRLRRGRLDRSDAIIEEFHGIPFFAPVWAPHVAQVGIVHHVHLGTWRHLLPPPAAALGHLLERVAVPLVYRRRPLVAVTGSTRAHVLRSYRADPERVSVTGNGVAPEFGPGGTRSPVPLVLVVSRLMPQKRVEDAVEAFALARAAVPGARLVIVGSGPERSRLETIAGRPGLEGSVELTGFVHGEELVDWYRRAWVVTSASPREGFGLTLAEAAACATPSVATRAPGHVDAVVDGRTGILADDVAGLADALVAVLTDAPLRDRLGGAARDHAAGWRWERTAAGILGALCDDADRRR